MKFFLKWVCLWLLTVFGYSQSINSQQTTDFTPIQPETVLPFRILIEQDNFSLPRGVQSFVFGKYKEKWLILAGRTNGLHGFNNNPLNFPPQEQNKIVYVVDPIEKTIAARSLEDASSGLTQDQIESLSTTSAQFYQKGNTLYVAGGYGYRSSLQNFTTFDMLTAIHVPNLIKWVENSTKKTAADTIRQISDPTVQITGGYMTQLERDEPVLLVFGQNFEGTYLFGLSSQVYSQQVRRFHIKDNGRDLSIRALPSNPIVPDLNFRRRDLNVVPIVQRHKGDLVPSLLALSGVFTPPPDNNIWTVPVMISAKGKTFMPDPNAPSTFKQAMNNYASGTIGLYSKKTRDMYCVLFGGLSYGFFQNGVFQTDSNIPFINQVTTIKIDREGNFSQHIMEEEFPALYSQIVNPGNRLLFGAGARFLTTRDISQYIPGVIKLDKLKEPILIGYIVGGIQSTVPNTTASLIESTASPFIFKVLLDPTYEANN
jgi:hypothetical protein